MRNGDGYRFDTRQKTYVGIIPALKDIKASCSEEHHRVAFDAVAHVVEVEVAAKRAELDARVVRRQLVDAFLNELPCPHSP